MGSPRWQTDAARINTLVDNERTYVLADLPRSITTEAQLQVNRPGHRPVVVPFNDLDPATDRTFAAFAFSDSGPFTASIFDANGAVLAEWWSS